MKDGIIKGTGDSRYLKGAGWPSTYAEFKAMAEAGTLPFDLNGINEAGWQQIGDALNKGNLLSDVSCSLIGIATKSVPDDAFTKLALGTGKYGYYIAVKDISGNALPGVTVSGVTTPTGGTCTTDSSGIAIGVSTATSVTLQFSHDFIDLNVIPSRAITSTGTITQVSVTATRKTTQYEEIYTSRTFRLSPAVSEYDVAVCGAGGGGGWVFYGLAGGAAGGSLAASMERKPTAGATYSVVIGAGGAPGPHITTAGQIGYGSTGGTSSFKEGSTTVLTAPGGSGSISSSSTTEGGGTGAVGTNGNGGAAGANGSAGTTTGFFPCGGGGAGANSGAKMTGGAPYGGHSDYYTGGTRYDGAAGQSPGGGGAGDGQNINPSATLAAESYGGAGGAKIAWRYAA